MFLSEKLYFPLESRRADWCVDLIEGIHCKLEDRKKRSNQTLEDINSPCVTRISSFSKGRETYLNIQIIYVIKKVLYAIFLSHIMQHDESYMYTE